MTSRLQRGRFYGSPVRAIRLAALTATETTYAPGLDIPAHAHDLPYFCLAVEGSFDETIGGLTRRVTPDSLVFHPEGEVHRDRFSREGGRCFNVEFGDRHAMLLRELDPPRESVHGAWSALAGLVSQMYQEFLRADRASALAIEGLALSLLAEVARAGDRSSRPAPPPWLDAGLDHIRRHFRETLTLADLAAVAGVHPVHFARTFRRHQGRTVGEHLRRLRVEWARRELAATDTPLAVIALEAGFADQSHLTRVFRRMTGSGPAAFRRLARAR